MASENFAIQKACEADLPALVPLLRELFSIEEDFEFEQKKQERGLKMLLIQGGSEIFVARSGDKIVGMGTVQRVVSTAEGGWSGLVEDVVVSKKWQGKGIGKALIEAVCRWAEAEGISRIQLLADRNNTRAIEFYKKMAFYKTQLVCLRMRNCPENAGTGAGL